MSQFLYFVSFARKTSIARIHVESIYKIASSPRLSPEIDVISRATIHAHRASFRILGPRTQAILQPLQLGKTIGVHTGQILSI